MSWVEIAIPIATAIGGAATIAILNWAKAQGKAEASPMAQPLFGSPKDAHGYPMVPTPGRPGQYTSIREWLEQISQQVNSLALEVHEARQERSEIYNDLRAGLRGIHARLDGAGINGSPTQGEKKT